MMNKKIVSQWVLGMLVLSASSLAMAATLDPKQALQNWLRSASLGGYQDCVTTAGHQTQLFLAMNAGASQVYSSSTSNNLLLQFDSSAINNDFLLKCLYGLDVVNQANCVGQSSGCTPVTLSLPSADDLKQLQTRSSTSSASSSTNPLSNFY